jgi:multiple sugar transport system permease protein
MALAAAGLLTLVWTLFPIYHILLIAVRPADKVFSQELFPRHITLDNFGQVIGQKQFYLTHFWRQAANSIIVAIMATVLVLTIGTLASFAISRLKPRWGSLVANVALATYVIPATFLAIPLYKVMATYGLLDSELALTIAVTAFATPYSIWVFTQHARASLPEELDEAARMDGAGAWRIYARIFLPLMKPALVAIGTYVFLMAWNEYLFAFLLLSSDDNLTIPVTLGSFLNSDSVPWNLLMASSLLYAIPPVVIFYLFRRNMTAGLTSGGVKD